MRKGNEEDSFLLSVVLFFCSGIAEATFMEGHLVMVVQGRDCFLGEYAHDLGNILDFNINQGATINTDLSLNLWGENAYWDDLHVTFLAYDKASQDAYLSSGGSSLTINGFFPRFSDAMGYMTELYDSISSESVFIADAPAEANRCCH